MACLAALTGVLNKMSAGKMPKEVAPYFCGANLFAAIKKQGGIRPVVVGEGPGTRDGLSDGTYRCAQQDEHQ